MSDIFQRNLTVSPDAAESAVGDETVILNLANGTYYGLDPVGTRIWAMLKEGVAIPDICRRLADDYGVDLEVIEADARTFLSDLETHGILVDD
jgi:hypothetical protein